VAGGSLRKIERTAPDDDEPIQAPIDDWSEAGFHQVAAGWTSGSLQVGDTVRFHGQQATVQRPRQAAASLQEVRSNVEGTGEALRVLRGNMVDVGMG